MKFSVNQKDLDETLSRVCSVAVNDEADILSHIKLEVKEDYLTLLATNREIIVHADVLINKEDVVQGEVALSAKTLSPIIRLFPEGNISVQGKEGTAEVCFQNGSAKFDVVGVVADNYPMVHKAIKENFSFTIESDVLKNLLEKASVALPTKSEGQGIPEGVLFSFVSGVLTIVATDSRRMVLAEHVTKDGNILGDFVVSRRTIVELGKLLSLKQEVQVFFNESEVMFKLGSITFISKLLDARFPNYKGILPKEFVNTLEIDRKQLLSTLKRISCILGNDMKQAIYLHIAGDELEVVAVNNSNAAEEKLIISYEDEACKLSFTAQVIIDAINIIDDETVKIQFNTNSSPLKIVGQKPIFTLLNPLIYVAPKR